MTAGATPELPITSATNIPVPTAVLQVARQRLARFVVIQAEAMAKLSGFGWEPKAHAPSDHHNLLRAYARSQLTGQPLPVSDQHCELTIYDSPAANFAFRFWHDVTHIRLGRGFDLDGEIEVSVAHLDVLRANGFRPGSLEFELLHTDTLGQALCSAATGDFPENQLCFARLSLTTSLSTAIRAELRTHPEQPS